MMGEGGKSFNKLGFRSQAETLGHALEGPPDLELSVHCTQMVCPKEIAALNN